MLLLQEEFQEGLKGGSLGFVIPDGIERRAGLQQGHQQIQVLLSCCPDVQTGATAQVPLFVVGQRERKG